MLHFPRENSPHRNLPCTHTERHIYNQNPTLPVLIFHFPTALLAVSDICTSGSCSLECFQLTQLVVTAFQSFTQGTNNLDFFSLCLLPTQIYECKPVRAVRTKCSCNSGSDHRKTSKSLLSLMQKEDVTEVCAHQATASGEVKRGGLGEFI